MRKEYTPPTLDIVTFKVELGFVTSSEQSAVSNFEFQLTEAVADNNDATQFTYSDWSW